MLKQKKLSTHVHSGPINNHQKVETTRCPSADEQINKLGYPRDGILFSHKKEWSSNIVYDMDEH